MCVDVPSDGEAIVGKVKKLTCIYCMKREEILATTKVEWFYKGQDKNKTRTLIYLYDGEPQEPKDVDEQWKGRVTWTGSKDMQDVSISILNVTLNDTGTYECEVTRFFEFDSFKLSANKNIRINLKVNMRGKSTQHTPLHTSQFVRMYWITPSLQCALDGCTAGHFQTCCNPKISPSLWFIMCLDMLIVSF